LNYIISGDRGLIGSHLKKRLDQEGNKCVMEIDKRNGLDINYLNRLNQKVDADVFFHFAAQCKINQAIQFPILPFENNVRGIFEAAEYCRLNKIPRMMFSSSSRILSPEKNPYTASKQYGEDLLEAYRQCYGLESIVIRPSTVYGPCYDETGRALHNFVVNALRGDDLVIYGDKNKTLDFTYIDDFIDGIILSMNKWNESYNISGGEETKLVNVANKVITATDSKSKIIFKPAEIAQPQRVNVDITKIKSLGFKPKVSLDDGIQRMVDWYSINPMAWRRYKEEKIRTFNGGIINE
jgi:nucleoside-diphosphate-sugar epimerase